MKIFIIYASAGFGHKKVAEAINETAISQFERDSILLFDILDYAHPLFKFLYSRVYIFLISRLKWLWAFLFFLTDNAYLKFFSENLKYANISSCSRFLDFIKTQQPDYIISTHFLVNELVSLLKENNQIKTRLISIITDFGVHNYWLAKNVNTYVVASDQTRDILISKNINIQKINVLGIPSRKQFQKEMNKETIREKIGIKNDRFTMLILTGGVGIGPIYEIVKLSNDRINVVVICGYNKKLYSRLKELHYENLIVLGWVDYVEEMMKISDIIVTKPGGSSISECLIMGLPMIFFSIIPGQEFQNAKIIYNAGMGFILDDPKKIVEKILYLKDHPQELKTLRDKIESFRIKDTNLKILNLIDAK